MKMSLIWLVCVFLGTAQGYAFAQSTKDTPTVQQGNLDQQDNPELGAKKSPQTDLSQQNTNTPLSDGSGQEQEVFEEHYSDVPLTHKPEAETAPEKTDSNPTAIDDPTNQDLSTDSALVPDDDLTTIDPIQREPADSAFVAPDTASHLAPNALIDSTTDMTPETFNGDSFEGGFEENSYLDAIAELEETYGPYHNELSQYLMGLGINYQHNGKHKEASEIFQRAMHVSRISEGLYSLGQVPILEHLIESNVASGDWEGASESHQYLYWLYRRNYGEEDPRMLPAITKLSSWHLNAYAVGMGSGMFQHLISAHNLYTMAVNIIDRTYGQTDMRLVGALKGLTVSNYYLATYQASVAKRAEFESSFSSQRASIDEKARLDQYILNSYSSGKHAISRIRSVYASNPEAPEEADVIAEIQLADWNLLFNRWHTAIEMYQDAYDRLAQAPDAQVKLNQYFGHPVALPDLPLIKGNTEITNDSSEYVLVNFSVSKSGQAKDIEILESYPEDDVRNRSQVRKALKITKFRPRFEDGLPTDTPNLTQRYVFAN